MIEKEKYSHLLRKRFYLSSITIITILALIIISYSFYLGNNIAKVYTPLVDATMEIKLEATTAHLWFEEIISGDRHEDIEIVWKHLEKADWYAKAMLDGGENSEGIFIPLKSDSLRIQIIEVRAKIEKLKNITLERYTQIKLAGAGTDIDEYYDAVFRDFILQVDEVETRLQKIIAERLSYFNKIQITLASTVLLLAFILAIIFYRNEQNKKRDYFNIYKLNKNLEKENSERKQAEKDLYIERDNLKNIFNSMQDGIYIINKDYDIEYVNAALKKDFGPPEGKKCYLYFHNINEPCSFCKNKEVYAGKTVSWEWTSPKGKTYDLIDTPMKNADGSVSKLEIFRDITERKKTEEELRESEAKLNALFNSLTEMVVMHELVLNDVSEAIDYRIIDCNKIFTEITGIRKEDAIGKLASQVYQTNPPPYLEEFAKVALGGDPHEFTTYYTPLDKHFMISVVSPQAGKFATITTDISDMMQIQEIILAKNKEMENYLYVASHDLRSPLVNIQGFSQRLKKQADSIKTLFKDKTLEPEILHQLGNITDEGIPKTLSYILSNIEKMDTLINGLLQLSRTGRVEVNIQKIDMNALFAKILQSLDFQIKEAQCKIHIIPLPECYGDAALLDQLFANIISNALKYADSERALEITVDAKKIYNRVVYTIRDTGQGIAQKHLDKIWDVFYRIDPRSGKTGEGIGLSLVKRIAEKHKGKVWAESEENKGSVFHIELHNRAFTEL